MYWKEYFSALNRCILLYWRKQFSSLRTEVLSLGLLLCSPLSGTPAETLGSYPKGAVSLKTFPCPDLPSSAASWKVTAMMGSIWGREWFFEYKGTMFLEMNDHWEVTEAPCA